MNECGTKREEPEAGLRNTLVSPTVSRGCFEETLPFCALSLFQCCFNMNTQFYVFCIGSNDVLCES